jgi:predicted small secreted protein
MARSERERLSAVSARRGVRQLAFVALGCAALAACNAIAGLGEFQDVPCEPCSEAGSLAYDSGPPPGDVFVPDDGTSDAGPDAADATVADTGFDAPIIDDVGPVIVPDTGVPIDYRWARWTMPNGAEAGLPNPASYTPVAGSDGGLFDNVTKLTWGSAQTAITDAGAACTYPFRLPTRIELVSILDTSQSPVLVNPAFTTMRAAVYWTSSVTPDGTPWTVDFGEGYVEPSTTATDVICVQPVTP